MFTLYSSPPDKPLHVYIGPNSHGDNERVMVLGFDYDSNVSGTSAYKKLAIRGTDHQDYVGHGKWHYFDFATDPTWREVAQSGQWRSASGTTDSTTYKLREWVGLSERMEGWIVQPDINQQVFLPIIAADRANRTITVAGSYAALGCKEVAAQGSTPAHAVWQRFRIYAPPGIERRGPGVGLLSHSVAAESSRCLYAGFAQRTHLSDAPRREGRYETPCAGLWDAVAEQAVFRQGGFNFSGFAQRTHLSGALRREVNYTLHRHYDPFLMRFMSPDPLASPFYNLFHYCGNNPAGAYDPDGLAKKGHSGMPRGMKLKLDRLRQEHKRDAAAKKRKLLEDVQRRQARKQSGTGNDGQRNAIHHEERPGHPFEGEGRQFDGDYKYTGVWFDASAYSYDGVNYAEAHVCDYLYGDQDGMWIAASVAKAEAWSFSDSDRMWGAGASAHLVNQQFGFHLGNGHKISGGWEGVSARAGLAGGLYGFGFELGADLVSGQVSYVYEGGAHWWSDDENYRTALGLSVGAAGGAGIGFNLDIRTGVSFNIAWGPGVSVELIWGQRK